MNSCEELENCAVCFLSFNLKDHRPKILPCMHTICSSCVDSLRYTLTGSKHQSKSSFSKGKKIDEYQQKMSNCPFCRNEFLQSLVQDNRYILAHLHHVERARIACLQPPASAPHYSSLPEDFMARKNSGSLKWCTDCQIISSEGSCGSHVVLPLSQFIESKSASSRALLTNLEIRVLALSSSVQEMQKIFENIFSSMKETLREFENIHENVQNFKSQVMDLKQMYENINIPSDENSLRPYSKVFKDMGDSCEWLSTYLSQMENRINSENLSWGSFDIKSNGEKFSVSCKYFANTFELFLKKN